MYLKFGMTHFHRLALLNLVLGLRKQRHLDDKGMALQAVLDDLMISILVMK